VFEAVTGYMPIEFERFWRYDPRAKTFEKLDDGPGEQALPVIFSTADGLFAMGIYSPDQPSPGFDKVRYGRFRFKNEKVVKWNCVFRMSDPLGIAAGDYRFRNFVVVGTLEDVRTALSALVAEFAG
jgi:hypothetical protein